MADEQKIYRVIFHSHGSIYEVYVREVYQSDLHGFIEIGGYVFGSRSQMLVDPSEEKLKSEFAGVERSCIPMHCVVRIDEVEQEGQARIQVVKGDTVMPFPAPPPRKSDS